MLQDSDRLRCHGIEDGDDRPHSRDRFDPIVGQVVLLSEQQ